MDYNLCTIPTWLMDIFLFIGVIVIIELLAIVCRYYIAWKFKASGDLKQYNFLIRIFLYLLAVPVIIFGLFPMLAIPNSLFDESDVLAYYGALIGGGVTVLGVYWTLKYESEKTKEERKESSWPIFTFSINSVSENHCNAIRPFVIGENLKDKFENEDDKLNKLCKEKINRIIELNKKIDELNNEDTITSKAIEDSEAIRDDNNINKVVKSIDDKTVNMGRMASNLEKEIKGKINERRICRLDKFIILNINNIGLQTAILSTIKFIPKGVLTSYNESKPIDLKYLSVQKGEDTKLKVIFDCYFENQDSFNAEFQEFGYLELKYTDLYSNKYEYNIPFKIKREIVQEKFKIPIEQFSLIIDTPQLPIRPKANK